MVFVPIDTTTSIPAQTPKNSPAIIVGKSSSGFIPTSEEVNQAQVLLGGVGSFQGARVGDIVGNARVVGINPQGGIIVQPANAPFTLSTQVSPIEIEQQSQKISQEVQPKLFTSSEVGLSGFFNRAGKNIGRVYDTSSTNEILRPKSRKSVV